MLTAQPPRLSPWATARQCADLGSSRVFQLASAFLMLSLLFDGARWMPETCLSISPPSLFKGQLVGAGFVLQPQVSHPSDLTTAIFIYS